LNFIDEAVIAVQGGRGGNGCLAFRREKYVPRGGPSGGDGGHGGSVVLTGDDRLNTLFHLRFQSLYEAERGRHGEGSNRTGASGADLEIGVPLGTVVHDAASGEVLGELLAHGQRLRVAAGAGATPASPPRPTRRRGGTSRGARARSGGCGWSSSCWPTSASWACPTPESRP
jgi:GTP-binding protein